MIVTARGPFLRLFISSAPGGCSTYARVVADGVSKETRNISKEFVTGIGMNWRERRRNRGGSKR